MEIQVKIKQGECCTQERAMKSKIAPRIAEDRGVEVTFGQMDSEHCYLDFLKNNGLLGNEEDSIVRYDTGYSLRWIYFECHSSGTSCVKEMGSNDRGQFTTEDDTVQDVAAEKYHRIMTALPAKYRNIIEIVCTGNPPMAKTSDKEHELIIDGLDALWGAFRVVK